MERERINWWVVGAATVVGVGAIVVGLSLGDWSTSAWSSVAIEVGSAIGLVSAVVLLERRMVGRVAKVAESTARAEAKRVTQDLRGRIESLEELDAAQQDAYATIREEGRKRLHSVRAGEVTSAVVGDLLVAAINDRIFSDRDFHLRTSADPACPVLYAAPWTDPSRVLGVYLDVEPIRMADQSMNFEGRPIPVPQKNDATVLWMNDDAATVGAELVAGLERRNEPLNGFGFGYALEMLMRSIEVMREARAAPAGDPRRMVGSLLVLINDEWAYTSEGLEAITATTVVAVKSAGWALGTGQRYGRHLFMSQDERFQAEAPLSEALAWLETREGVHVLEPGTDAVEWMRRNRW